MGLKLKNIVRAVNPITSLGMAKDLLVGKEGPANAYAPPDLSYLRTPQTPPDYSRLLNPSSYWTDYVNTINAPSSVDAVRAGMNTEALKAAALKKLEEL